jgi:hypothetical protein
VVRYRVPRSRRRQYSFVEAVTKLDHGLSASDLHKAYRIAGSKYGANLKKTFLVLDDTLYSENEGTPVGPVSEVAAGLAHLDATGEANSTTSSTRKGYFTQVSPVFL